MIDSKTAESTVKYFDITQPTTMKSFEFALAHVIAKHFEVIQNKEELYNIMINLLNRNLPKIEEEHRTEESCLSTLYVVVWNNRQSRRAFVDSLLKHVDM